MRCCTDAAGQEHFSGLAAKTGEVLSPNLLLTLDGYAVRWGKLGRKERKKAGRSKDGTYNLTYWKAGPERWEASLSSETGTHVIGSEVSEAFRMLVRWLRLFARVGRTSAIESFDQYFEANSSAELRPVISLPKLKRTPEAEA